MRKCKHLNTTLGAFRLMAKPTRNDLFDNVCAFFAFCRNTFCFLLSDNGPIRVSHSVDIESDSRNRIDTKKENHKKKGQHKMKEKKKHTKTFFGLKIGIQYVRVYLCYRVLRGGT